MYGAKPFAFICQAIFAWFVITATILVSVHYNHLYLYILSVIIIATRINILALLIHDQSHFLGFRSHYGEIFANLFTALPLGTTIGNYAQVHLSHHRHFFTQKDPDHLRKSGDEWTFPMSKIRLTKMLLCDITGLTFIQMVKGKQLSDSQAFIRKKKMPTWIRLFFYLSLIALFTYTSTWYILFFYWIVPLVTIFPLIVRLGAITEHVYNLPNASINDTSPLIILRWWEKNILPNLNFTYHSYHHFYPGISFVNLPKVHEIYCNENLVNTNNVFNGYLAYLNYLQSSPIKIVCSEKLQNAS